MNTRPNFVMWKYWRLLVAIKRLLGSHVDCFCHRCGYSVRDYYAPDDLWAKAMDEARKQGIEHNPHNEGGVWCFNCFIDLLFEAGIHYVPKLGNETIHR